MAIKPHWGEWLHQLIEKRLMTYDLHYSFHAGPSYWSAIAPIFKICTHGENISMNSSDAKTFNPQRPQIETKCLNGFLTAQPLIAHTVLSPWKWAQVLFPKSKKGKEKRRYSLLVFWMESFRSTDRLSYWDNGSRPPAAFSLLLSLPILRLSICLWAETHGTSCSTQHTSQKFTSFSSALLLHTNPIPRTCINSPSYAQTA